VVAKTRLPTEESPHRDRRLIPKLGLNSFQNRKKTKQVKTDQFSISLIYKFFRKWPESCINLGMVDIHRPELKHKRRMMQRLALAIFVTVLLVIGALVFRMEPAVPKIDGQSVWSDTVREGEFVIAVRGQGSLVPRNTRWVPASSAGRVERIAIRPGAWVEPDSVLVELSNPELVQEAEELRWDVDAMAAGLTSLEAELERQLLDARSTLAVVSADHESANLEALAEEELAERGIVSRIRYRQTRLRADQLHIRVQIEKERIEQLKSSVKAQVAAEQARLEQARHRYHRHQQRLEDLSVRAGVAGVLQRIDVEEGQQLQPGVNVGRVAQPDELIAELRIPESQAGDVRLDQVVSIDTRGAKIEGRVMRIDPAVVNGSVQVDVALNGSLPVGARPDLSVDGMIEIERVANTLFVGRPAYGEPGATVRLFRIDGQGQANRVPVQLGRASVHLIEIQSGLQPGDLVILSDTSNWNGHERIRMD